MADLKSLLSSFGLLQYHERLVEAGFDAWETILDITESDLDYLGVRLGHRRRLQQEIAHTLSLREVTQRQRPRALPRLLPLGTKRQYTPHPKPDPHAPQRPLSAYVLVSNNVRAELKERSLSFSEQSRIAGERWQDISNSAKDSWKQAANGTGDGYKTDKVKYQSSEPYYQYQEHMVESKGLQSSQKRKGLSDDLLHEVNEVQTHHPPSSGPHQKTASKRIARSLGFAPPESDTASPSLLNAVDKLGAWERTLRRIQPKLEEGDQDEIRELLRMSPQAEEAKSISVGQVSCTNTDGSKADSSEDPGGEDDASNVGSMGSTDHLNEESFAGETGKERIHSFLGQTASDTWVERIKQNLKISDDDEPKDGHGSGGGHSPGRQNEQTRSTATDPNPESPTRASMFQEHVEPYELPPKASTDSLVAAYFAAVHPVFPIVSRSQFMGNYETFFASRESGGWSTSMFVPMLHIVLAVGAVHAYMTHARWVRDERSHLLSFAKAKVSILDTCILRASAYEQIQLCGLGGLYMLIMYDINK
ncbi:MAG: hypothetical protein Q9226_003219 [Calogaya cf. arnoldii]